MYELKIKDNVNLKELEKYGFKREPEHQYYFIKTNEAEVFVWAVEGDSFLKRHIYIEIKQCETIIFDLSVIYDLIKDDLVEKVEV